MNDMPGSRHQIVLCCIAMTNYTNTYTCRIITTHNKDERHSSLEKYTSHFIWKGCVWEGVGEWTELQHIDPHSIGHNRVSVPFSWAAQPGASGPSLSGTCSSIQHLLSNCNCSIGGLRAHSAGCWLSLPYLVSNSSDRQLTDFLSSPGLYNNLTSTLLPASVTIALIQPVHGQDYILIFLDRMHLLFTQVHLLFWQPGWVGGQYKTDDTNFPPECHKNLSKNL